MLDFTGVMSNYPTNLLRHGFDAKVVEPSGDGTSRIYVLGEAPGEMESVTGIAFHPKAPAGSMLERLLKRMGKTRDGLRISNVCWQRPPRNFLERAHYEAEALETWRPFIEDDIARVNPKVIVVLGNTALRALTPYGGKGASITDVAAYVLSGDNGRWIIPTYHPSYLLQGAQHLSGAFIYALSRAHEIVRSGFARRPVDYVPHPTLDSCRVFEAGFDPERHQLSADIETPESGRLDEEQLEEEDVSYTILRISFCYRDSYAISVPWSPPFIDFALRMLRRAKRIRYWNAPFDHPRLQANDARITARVYDAMEGWSFLQRSLPRSLGFVTPFYGWTGEPWKHLSSSEPEWYSCADSHALHQNAEGIERDLRSQGRWETFERHVVETYEVLTLMSRNGLPYSSERAEEFEKELEAKYDERFTTLQRLVPDDLKPVKQKKGLLREPKDTTGYVLREFSDVDEQHNITSVHRWALLEPFLPTSPKQVADVIKWLGDKPGRNYKTDKSTTDDDTLRKLYVKRANATRKRTQEEDRKAAQIYLLIRECRQLRKVLGTYVKGWKPGKDGRIHATPGFWGKMYRISWRRPNIAATIADKQEEMIAAGFRKCVAARPDHVLVEADWKGMEAVLVGWFAGDVPYMRLARLGVHSFMASHMLGRPLDLSLSDEALALAFKEIKADNRQVYDDAKHTIHGTNYGMGPKLMAELYEMPERRAKELQDLYFGLFPKVKAWQKSVLDRASMETKLTNPFGYVMWFWDVYHWDSKRYAKLRHEGQTDADASANSWALGKDAKSAISFLPRDTAAAMLKEALLRLRPLAEDGVLLSSTHDSILGETTEDKAMDLALRLKEEMEKPVPELGGLSIGVDLKWGVSWTDEDMRPLLLPHTACSTA